MARFDALEVVPGVASGVLMHADVGLSFWGGVDPLTGEVTDHTHPLYGQYIAGKILAIPNGRGSSTGSQVMLELILNGVAPAALVLRQPDSILALGVIVAEEVFQMSMPIVSLGHEAFDSVSAHSHVTVYGPAVVASGNQDDTSLALQSGLLKSHTSTDELITSSGLVLTSHEESMLAGHQGEAKAIAMRILVRAGAVERAPGLLSITQAHIDACTYIGPGGLRFAQLLAAKGARVAVPTTLNAGSVDRRRWAALGISPGCGEPAQALGDAYVAMGCDATSFTCAPYLLNSAPGLGEQVAWGESNAVVFANSVLGARTQKYADYLDICAAITGRAPRTGAHLDFYRAAAVVLDASALLVGDNGGVAGACGEAFWPVLGYLCGAKAAARVPLIVGLEGTPANRDDLKAFSAAFGSTASAPLFHMAGHTPEAQLEMGTATARGITAETIALMPADLASAWCALDSNGVGTSHEKVGGDLSSAASADGLAAKSFGRDAIELVALGNPHLSLTECAALAALCAASPATENSINVSKGASSMVKKHPGVSVVATLGREVMEQAETAGHAQVLRDFGVSFINDTCWCMLTEPVVPVLAKRLVTNSAKYAHYAPALVGRRVRFTDLKGCVEAARNGFMGPRPSWVADATAASEITATARPSSGRRGIATLATVSNGTVTYPGAALIQQRQVSTWRGKDIGPTQRVPSLSGALRFGARLLR